MDTGEGNNAAKPKGRYVMGTSSVNLPIPNMEMRHPLKDGVSMWERSFVIFSFHFFSWRESFGSSLSQSPLLRSRVPLLVHAAVPPPPPNTHTHTIFPCLVPCAVVDWDLYEAELSFACKTCTRTSQSTPP